MADKPTSVFSQSDLYQALKKRKGWAYDHVYSELSPSFRYWVERNSGSEMDAEDAFHKGLMNFYLNLETDKYEFRESVKITTVIFDYCKKVWLNELASSRVKTRTVMPDAYDPANDTDLQRDLERGETIVQVRAALDQLKADCRQMIEYFYLEELSLKEIAKKMGMKENSTKQKRYDCTEKLKQLVLKQDSQNG